MVSCAMAHCKSYYRNANAGESPRVKFFRFPKEKKFSNIWLQRCKRKDPVNVKQAFICSKHFSREHYIRNLQHELLGYSPKSSKKLILDAIPTEDLPLSSVMSTVDEQGSLKRKLLCASGSEVRSKRQKVREQKSFVQENEKDSPVCCVLSCWNFGPNSNRQDVSYHSFPDDPDLSRKWWGATGRKLTNDFDPSGYTICSLHFSDSDWVEEDSQKILKATAFPHQKLLTKPYTKAYSLAVCRLCLTTTDVLGDLFSEDLASKYLVKMLGRVLETEVVEDYVNWPRKICINCFNSIHKFGKFCQEMKNSLLTIKERYGDPEKKIAKVVEFVDVNSGEFLMETSEDGREPVLEFREMYRIQQTVPNRTKIEEGVVADTVESTSSSFISNAEPRKSGLKQKYHELVCGNCPGETFPYFQNLQDHLRTVHPETSDGSVECCGGLYQYLNKFVIHMKTHKEIQKAHGPSIQSEELVIQMPIQIAVQKPPEPAFECEFCDAKLYSGKNLISHINLIHPEKRKEYRCSECKIAYYSEHHYNKHMLSHVPSPDGMQCESCDEKYSTPHQLQLHTRIEHTNTSKQTKVCDVCGLATTNLSSHMKSHSLTVRRKRCLRCGRCVKNLQRHSCTLAILNDPRECPVCQKTFKNRFSLTLHFNRIHREGVKQFQCSICDRVFKRTGLLKDHIASKHTKELQYKCDFCDMEFCTYTGLYGHQRLKHKEEYELILKKKYDVL